MPDDSVTWEAWDLAVELRDPTIIKGDVLVVVQAEIDNLRSKLLATGTALQEANKAKRQLRIFTDVVTDFLCRDWDLEDGPSGARLCTSIGDAPGFLARMKEIAVECGGKVVRRDYPKPVN